MGDTAKRVAKGMAQSLVYPLLMGGATALIFYLGPLRRIISAADLHRWHHSRDCAEADHNYGGVLLLWDVVFGTWYAPPGRPASVVIGR